MGVMSAHTSLALSGAAASAFRRSAGTRGSGSSSGVSGTISSVTRSPAWAPAASNIFRSTFSQWPPLPSGWRVAWIAAPLIVPSTDTRPREGSFALACFGKVRKSHDPETTFPFAVGAGRKRVAANRIGRTLFDVAFFMGTVVLGKAVCRKTARAAVSGDPCVKVGARGFEPPTS